MAYTKHTWTNGSGEALNATNLNEMETGIGDAHDDLVTHAADTSTHGVAEVAGTADITTHAALTTGTHGVTGTILGTEDKDVNNGVALLSGVGRVLAPGNAIQLARDGTNKIWIGERTSDEYFLQLQRIGTNDYEMKINESGTLRQMVTHGDKNVSGGYPELVNAPVATNSTGTAGQMAYDSSYFYICTATDTWKRVSIAGW